MRAFWGVVGVDERCWWEVGGMRGVGGGGGEIRGVGGGDERCRWGGGR